MRSVRTLGALLPLGLLALGVRPHALPARAYTPALEMRAWAGWCFFGRGSAALDPGCKRQLEALASCWLDPHPNVTRDLLAERRFRLHPFMSEEEFKELRSDRLAWARGEAVLDFLVRLGVPRELVTLELLDGGRADLEPIPQDPANRRVDLIGCQQMLHSSPSNPELPPFPERGRP